jgi:CP family cyanate transporter-like MFS transporter
MDPVTPTTTVPTRVAVAPALLVAAILLLALNMRGPIVAVSPVTEAIRADLGVDGGTVGLLTSLPVLCFGLATPPASALLARLGLGRGVLVALAVLLAGIVVRSLGGLPAALVGTVLIGAAITVANVAVPVVIGRELADRTGPVLGAYTAALNVGSMLTLSLTVPIADATGWQIALAVCGGCWWSSRPPSGGGRRARWCTARPRLRPPSRSTRATAGGAARSCGASPSPSRGRRSPTTA